MALPRWPTELIGGDKGNQFTWDSELVCFHSWPLSTSGSQSSLSSVLMQHPAFVHSVLPRHSLAVLLWALLSSSSPRPVSVLPLFHWILEKGASCPSPILWSDILSPQSWEVFPQETQTEAIHIPPGLFHSAFLRQPRKGQDQ